MKERILTDNKKQSRKVKSSVIRTTFKIIFLISFLGFYYMTFTSNFINNNLIKNNLVVSQKIDNKINGVLIDSVVQDKNKREIQTSNVKNIDNTIKIYNSNTNTNDNDGSDNAANFDNHQLNDKNQTDSATDDTQQNSQGDDAGNNSNKNENNANNFTLQLLNLINSVRLSNGLCQLNQNQALNPVAQSRSSDMINRDYFSHTTPDGKNIYNILQDYGIMYAAAGENLIFASPPSYASPEYFFNTWMNSDTHRANILSSLFTQIGIGIGANSDRLVAVLVFIN
jgi:uncharacterized protein YkwD